ncbi:MAG: enoyl-CoA hydratase/isomerase family protein [Massilia sp.]|jgi:2-(1,2-epoxy-1,2-dihydrophenyl)acetyl-CoA isomerase|nr:enoyl-CoA hydratase/isomerase family protein [Massilia sp.]MDB5952545.1 enoyl-CoA hydratase/isomerase family protein [Massilia sp.]
MNKPHDELLQGEPIDEPVLLSIANGLATMTLNTPARSNGINLRWAHDVGRFIDQVANTDGVRVLLIRANGPRFCAGADLDWLRPGESGAGARIDDVLLTLNPALIALRSLPLIVVAAVHGAVAGGGFGLMNAADLVIASSETQFTLAYTRIGATPDCGASYWLPRILGERSALELMLLSEVFNAQKAHELGLVNFVAGKESFDAEVRKLVNRLLDGPPHAYAAVKQLTYQSLSAPIADQLDHERRLLVQMTRGGDFKEGVQAFVEKRVPCFGRIRDDQG